MWTGWRAARPSHQRFRAGSCAKRSKMWKLENRKEKKAGMATYWGVGGVKFSFELLCCENIFLAPISTLPRLNITRLTLADYLNLLAFINTISHQNVAAVGTSFQNLGLLSFQSIGSHQHLGRFLTEHYNNCTEQSLLMMSFFCSFLTCWDLWICGFLQKVDLSEGGNWICPSSSSSSQSSLMSLLSKVFW